MEWSKLIEQRRSIRQYQNRPVEKEIVEDILKDTLLAPTWKNSETGRYYIILDPEKVQEISEKALPPFNRKNSQNAALVVTAFEKGISGWNGDAPANELENEWGAYDLGLQNAYFILAARERGLDTLIMGIRDGDALRALLDIPESQEVVAVLALGYREGEAAFRPRKTPDEVSRFI